MIDIKRFREDWSAPALGSALLLAIAIILGGASRQHELRLALVELAALPLMVIGTIRLLSAGPPPASRLFLGIMSGIVALPLIQIIPLPPAIWTRLPGREELIVALELSGIAPGWAPLSLTPDKTWRSALALLPPIAIVLGVLASPSGARRRLVNLLIALVAAAVLLGAAQLASGGEQLYPWQTTNAASMTGFFANRNHMATLALIMLPLVAALLGRELRRPKPSQMVIWISLAMILLLIIAIGAIRSRMGLALLGPVLVGSLVVAWTGTGRRRPPAILFGLFAVAGIGLFALFAYALPEVLARFGNEELRFENWGYVLEAAGRYAPLGSGIGSFDAVFRSVEPLERLDRTYFNQAHNDYLETWLEAGFSGFALIAAFAIWFARRTWSAWRTTGSTEIYLARGATVSLMAILVHSVVDYPLRTATIATLFAFLCVILEGVGVNQANRSR